ncbi:uncharacterized protein BDZ83DRAFT_265700 [Colletotrichum acutatum]|uniref:Uncharacterized protein n=1 Tax=Glomerella acutata TaxID=27357 RepID=A0AAD8US67_GLOAC|nr:uncharacterized protein BDZ83DRAFT_265700 [Colletotrichum acutatum]KAK1726174.1 hypothetical protein BDZ83DRAFT_265700 [Colletotrichum acutatum]
MTPCQSRTEQSVGKILGQSAISGAYMRSRYSFIQKGGGSLVDNQHHAMHYCYVGGTDSKAMPNHPHGVLVPSQSRQSIPLQQQFDRLAQWTLAEHHIARQPTYDRPSAQSTSSRHL